MGLLIVPIMISSLHKPIKQYNLKIYFHSKDDRPEMYIRLFVVKYKNSCNIEHAIGYFDLYYGHASLNYIIVIC